MMFNYVLCVLLSVALLGMFYWQWHSRPTPPPFLRRPKACLLPAAAPRARRKPEWMRHEIMRLKALMKRAGCRKIAATFNRLHAHVSVGKTFVAEVIAAHPLEIAELRRKIRSAQPRKVSVNHLWALDLTFFTDTQHRSHAIIGIIDHGSRLALRLQVLVRRCSWTMLGHLCLAIARYGKPRKVRTDNEAIFNSWVFNTFLKLAGIQHQTTQTHAPWQNGRIERLFGTLKSLLRQLIIPCGKSVQVALNEFGIFYNHVSPHQNLHGLTPAEHFIGLSPVDLRQMPIRQVREVHALCGLLRGYWIKR